MLRSDGQLSMQSTMVFQGQKTQLFVVSHGLCSAVIASAGPDNKNMSIGIHSDFSLFASCDSPGADAASAPRMVKAHLGFLAFGIVCLVKFLLQ